VPPVENPRLLRSKDLAEDISLLEHTQELLRQARRQNRPELAYRGRFQQAAPHTAAAAAALADGSAQAMLDARNALLAELNRRSGEHDGEQGDEPSSPGPFR